MVERFRRRSKLEYPPEIKCRSIIARVTDKCLFRRGVSYLNKANKSPDDPDKASLIEAVENAIGLAERINLVFEGPIWIDPETSEMVEGEIKNNEGVDARSVYLWLGMMRTAKKQLKKNI